MTSLANKKICQVLFLGPHLLRMMANMQKFYILKKICLVYFFKNDSKNVRYQKSENITTSIFPKALVVMMLFIFLTCSFY